MHRIYLFLFFLLSFAISQNIKKDIRVAVLGFEDNTKNTYSRNSITVGDYVLDELLSQLFKTEEVKIIERERLDAIMNEQNLQISGVVTSQSAVEIGNLLGIDYAIFGSINKATTEQKKSGAQFGDYGLNVKKSIARVSISLKMVDIQSGEIVFMDNFTKKAEDKTVGLADYKHNINFSNSKEFDKSLLGKAIRGAIKNIVKKVVKYIQAIPWKGRISKISGDKIYINAGEKQGVTNNLLFEVFKEGEEIIDPSSGKILAVEKFHVGILKVVNNNIGDGVASTCIVVSGNIFNENDLIQLLPLSKGITTGTVPIYRYYNKKNKDHFYTKNSSVKSTYTPQGIEFYAFPDKIEGTVPIYRYYNKKNKDHFYTKNSSVKSTYTPQGIEWHAFPDKIEGTVPIYRYYNKKNKDHFYTKNSSVKSTYTPQGIEFYAFER